MTAIGSSPASQTSKKRIVYKESAWNTHRFTIWSGEAIADVEVLKMLDSLFIWIGSPGQHDFTELALGVPAVFKDDGKGMSTMIVGEPNSTASTCLARRLASALGKPVYISCNVNMDRFTAPLLEKGLMLEIKNSVKYF